MKTSTTSLPPSWRHLAPPSRLKMLERLRTIRTPAPGQRATLTRKLAVPQLLEQIRENPSLILSSAGMAPDNWQARVRRSNALRILLLCSRQSGKTEVSAALALKT